MKQRSIEGTKNARAQVATNFACRFSLAETYPNALSLNSLLMEYRLISVLGVGAFGITYLARDVNLEKDVPSKSICQVRSPSAARTALLFQRRLTWTAIIAGGSIVFFGRRARSQHLIMPILWE